MNRPRANLPFWYGVAAIALLVPAAFWLRFRDLRIGFALAGFLVVWVLAVQLIPEGEPGPGPEPAAAKGKPGVLEWMCVVWLLAVPFAPFFAWVIGSAATVNAGNWRWVLGAEAFLCVAIPLTCVLPLLPYVRGRAAPYAMLILCLGTLFPVSIGWSSASDFVRGPQWESAKVVSSIRVHLTGRGRDTPTSTLKVRLSDGRVLKADSERVHAERGTCRILVLQESGLLLAVRR